MGRLMRPVHRKEITMTNKDREQYFEVLMALAGHGNRTDGADESTKKSTETEEPHKIKWLGGRK